MADAALQQKSPLANQPRDSSSLPTQAPADDDSFVSARIRPHHQWLQQSGKLLEASGVLTAEKYVLALHTDFGPLDQDKTTNQDYALAWQPSRTPVPPVPSLIVALADGLTSSFRSEWASALVCSVAARSLAESLPAESAPRQKLEAAVAAAQNALRGLAAELARDPLVSCPPGIFPATWNYMLRRGLLLQTTLTLAWLDGCMLRAAVIGDGGLLWRTEEPVRMCVEAQCDLTTEQVHALGPAGEEPVILDCYVERELSPPYIGALFTDGVGRGVGADPANLLEALVAPESAAASNPAEHFLMHAITEHSRDFADNLTLAVLRGF